jgi:hypothetical protein
VNKYWDDFIKYYSFGKLCFELVMVFFGIFNLASTSKALTGSRISVTRPDIDAKTNIGCKKKV